MLEVPSDSLEVPSDSQISVCVSLGVTRNSVGLPIDRFGAAIDVEGTPSVTLGRATDLLGTPSGWLVTPRLSLGTRSDAPVVTSVTPRIFEDVARYT